MIIPSPRGARRARIEIIPLIDIMFFLLATFVMVSLSMIKNKGIPVNLPVASTGSPQDRKHHVAISVTEVGELYLDKEAVSLAALPDRLKALRQKDPEIRIFINGDEKADFGLAIRALDLVRQAGITKVAIETKPKKGS